MAGRVAERVSDPNTDVELTKEGVLLSTRVASLESGIEAERLKSRVLVRIVDSDGGAPTRTEIPPRLVELASEYKAVDDPDRRVRAERKNELADAMGALVVKASVDREALAVQNDEVMTLALASASIVQPAPGDLALLMASGASVSRLHVRYVVAMR